LYRKHEGLTAQMVDAMALSNQFLPMASGSEDDNEDRDSKLSNDSERKVRVRTAISDEQQAILKEHYAVNPRPNREEFRTMSQRLMLDPRVVQVWFQNNRSRERKLSNVGHGMKPAFVPIHQNSISHRPLSPIYCPPPPPAETGDQPLDLSVKRPTDKMSPALSPKYGTAPQQPESFEEAMNLSVKYSTKPGLPMSAAYRRFFPYHHSSKEYLARQTPSPNEAAPRPTLYPLPTSLGMVPMERLFQYTPEMARHSLLGIKSEMGNSLSPSSERRSWKDDDSRISYDDDKNSMHAQYKRSAMMQHPSLMGLNGIGGVPKVGDNEFMFVCDQCDKGFNKQSSLARHKYEHSGESKKERFWGELLGNHQGSTWES
jgi:zinc finger homeobox protein 2